ncbi:hypothetical protein DFH09DRAFT_995865 [Mycena vulgaris]|nr:hypothetical protein DFH09DRAFT_995865 [Mycena vulgaris]
MPITELTTLELIAPCTLQSTPLVKLLKILAQGQSAYSAFPMVFFAHTGYPARIYTMSGWHSVEASHIWLASAEWRDLAQLFGPFLNLKGRVYLDIPFDTIPMGGTMWIRTTPSAFWESSGKELETESDTTYTMQAYTNEVWEKIASSMDRSAGVSMRPLALSQPLSD